MCVSVYLCVGVCLESLDECECECVCMCVKILKDELKYVGFQ